MLFYVGASPAYAIQLKRAFISAHYLRNRRKPVTANQWIMDSGGYQVLARHGDYLDGPAVYAKVIDRVYNAEMVAAVAQDYLCDPGSLAKTGLTVQQSQVRSTERWKALVDLVRSPVTIIPTIQGQDPEDYRRHLDMYGADLCDGAYVGVGSIVRLSKSPLAVCQIIEAIRSERPDLRLHGFGLKLAALRVPYLQAHLHSADSMAFLTQMRWEQRNGLLGHNPQTGKTIRRPESECAIRFEGQVERLLKPHSEWEMSGLWANFL